MTKILTVNSSPPGRQALHLHAFLLQRGMHVEGQRGRDARMSEYLRERLGVKSLLDASRGKGVPQRVEGVALNTVSAHQRLVSAVE